MLLLVYLIRTKVKVCKTTCRGSSALRMLDYLGRRSNFLETTRLPSNQPVTLQKKSLLKYSFTDIQSLQFVK